MVAIGRGEEIRWWKSIRFKGGGLFPDEIGKKTKDDALEGNEEEEHSK